MSSRKTRRFSAVLVAGAALAVLVGGAWASGVLASLPVPDIKVNGSDTFVTVPAGANNVTIDWNLAVNDWNGLDGDIFIVMMRLENLQPAGMWSLVQGSPSIVTGLAPYMSGPLTDLTGSMTLTVPSGITKKVWLTVDDVMNAYPDRPGIIYDHVILTVQ